MSKPDPSTGKFIAGAAMRQGSAIARKAMQKRLAAHGFSNQDIADIFVGKGFGKRAAAAAITRLATRSVPGAVLVGAGFVAKALFDRRGKARAAAKAETPDAKTADGAGTQGDPG